MLDKYKIENFYINHRQGRVFFERCFSYESERFIFKCHYDNGNIN